MKIGHEERKWMLKEVVAKDVAYQEQLGYPDMNRYTDTANTEMVNGWFHF